MIRRLAASRNDLAALEATLAQHRGRLRRMVALRLGRRLQGRVDPSDVIQEAYLEAARRLPVHPKLRNRSNHLRSFLRQAQAAAELHHTNIVTVYDYGQHDGVCYYAMQYIPGHSLEKVLEDVKRLKRAAEGTRERNGKVDSPDAPTAPLTATEPNVSAADLGLRSVSIGLVTGVFLSEPQASMQRLAAAMAGAAQSTQVMPSA